MRADDFFIIDNDLIKGLFQTEKVWEAIKSLPEFLERLFSGGEIKGNLGENVYIQDGVEVDETARIKGPAIILKGTKIHFNAYIRENVIIGENSKIGHGVEIKNSIVLNNSTIAHFNHIAESIIGNNINFAAGAQVANLRLDRKTVMVEINGQKIDTGLPKFGAIIGDNCQIGANSVINPGTILGKNCLVYPLTQVNGTHTPGSIIK